MKVLAIANQKGGVGKSTIAVHIVWGAVEQGLRVLLVDFDGQANATHTFTDQPIDGTQASALFDVNPVLSPARVTGHLSIIPADISINDIEGVDLGRIRLPASHLQVLSADYDLCVIDTPPNLGRRLLAALIAANAILSPMALNGYSLEGIADLQRTIITVKKKFNPQLVNLGILPNLVNQRSKTQQESLGKLREALGERVLPYILPNRVAVSDAIDNKHPVWKYTRGESSVKAGHEMKDVIQEIIQRVMQ